MPRDLDAKPAAAPRRRDMPAGPAPTRAALHAAALTHLGRYAATQAGLVRVLDRRIDRWARRAAAEGAEPAAEQATARALAREVAQALTSAGVVDDAAFAAARAARLTRAGRSRRAVSAHLAAKGVPEALAREALPDPADELAAAAAYARRRRLGPFRATDADDDQRRRELAAMARAGFPQSVAQQALRLDADEAGALIRRLKQG